MSAWRNVAPGTFARARLDLRRRDVDPGHIPAVGERRGHRDAGAAAQLEDPGAGRDQIARQAQVREPRLGRPERAPLEIPARGRVVAAGDDPTRIGGVVTQASVATSSSTGKTSPSTIRHAASAGSGSARETSRYSASG